MQVINSHSQQSKSINERNGADNDVGKPLSPSAIRLDQSPNFKGAIHQSSASPGKYVLVFWCVHAVKV